jgi:hypothetical protein
MLAAGEREAARAAANELAGIAAPLDSAWLRAACAQATGAVLLAEGDAPAALAALREAYDAWQQLHAPFESACVRVLIAPAARSATATRRKVTSMPPRRRSSGSAPRRRRCR